VQELKEMPAAEVARLTNRENIVKLEQYLKTMRQVEVPVEHFFAGGVYARHMRAAEGTLAVGKIIKVDNIAVISKGDVTIVTERGLVRVQAPYIWIAPAGTKRAAYFHTDTEWTVFHATQSTDPEEVEKEVIAQSFEEFDKLMSDTQALLGEVVCRG
jgi:hypothetical protein